MIRSFLTRSPEHRILVVTSPSIIDPTSNTPKVVVRIRCVNRTGISGDSIS